MTTEITGEIRRTPTKDIPCLNRIVAITKLQIKALGHAEALIGTPLGRVSNEEALATFDTPEHLIKEICNRDFPLISCPVPRGGVCARLESRAKEGIK